MKNENENKEQPITEAVTNKEEVPIQKPTFQIMLVSGIGQTKFLNMEQMPLSIIHIKNLESTFLFSNIQQDPGGNFQFVYKEVQALTLKLIEGDEK